MTSRNIELLSPVPFAGTMVNSLTFREIRMKDLATFGEPSILTRTTDGAIVFVENVDAIAGYIRALVPVDLAGVIEHVGLADSLRLKDVVLSLFSDARSAGAPPVPGSSLPISDGLEPETSAS